jgi:hypothetical protein
MRLIATLLQLFCVAGLLTSCQPDNPLTGTWRFERVEVAEGSATRIPPTVENLWDGMKDKLKLELNSGGSFTSSLELMFEQAGTREGSWRQSEDGKTLYLKHNNADVELAYTITEITEQRLKLLWASQDLTLVLVRVGE